MIRKARRSCGQLDNALFAPAPAEAIPWAEDYFTHILSIESVYYWHDLSTAAREMFRVATHGGSFHVLINYYEENEYSEGWDRETGLSLHRLDAERWSAIFRAQGFQEVVTDRIPDDSPISPGKPPLELERREGLQRVGALYITGRKPKLPERQDRQAGGSRDAFRILR